MTCDRVSALRYAGLAAGCFAEFMNGAFYAFNVYITTISATFGYSQTEGVYMWYLLEYVLYVHLSSVTSQAHTTGYICEKPYKILLFARHGNILYPFQVVIK